jgi:hypothetical protein
VNAACSFHGGKDSSERDFIPLSLTVDEGGKRLDMVESSRIDYSALNLGQIRSGRVETG